MRVSLLSLTLRAGDTTLGGIGIIPFISFSSESGSPHFGREEGLAWLYPEMSQTQAVHTDSINSQDPNNEGEKKAKSRRPASEIAKPTMKPTWADGGELMRYAELCRYCVPATAA